jgi:hypothetical protein
VSTIPSDALKDIALTADLGERLTLIFVFGPSYLAAAGLDDLEGVLSPRRAVARHRVDRDGPSVSETIVDVRKPRPAVLVSGFDRLTETARRDALVSMNLLRDTLNDTPAVVVMWIPQEIADEFRRHCLDLFQWRTLTVFVDPPTDDPRAEQQRVRHAYLLRLASTRPTRMVARRVSVAGQGTQEIGAWLDRVELAGHGVLVGPAGSGKTTELRRYAANQASALLDGDAEIPLPVSSAARHLHAGKLDCRALARSASPRADDETVQWLERELASSRVMLLIDGLDEIPPSTRDDLEHQLLALIALNPDLRVIVSTRNTEAPTRWLGWQRARLEPLGSDAIAAWLVEAGVEPRRFMPMLTTGPVKELAGNPLSLQLLTELCVREGPLPTVQITELTRMIVDRRIEHWDVQRGVARGVTVSTEVLRRFMSTLAANMTRDQQPAVDTSIMREVAAEVVGPRSRSVDPLELLRPGLERSGLLRDADPPHTGYTFVHALFRDYFAGLWLVQQDLPPDQLTVHAIDPVWQRAVVHALALLSPRELEATFEQIWKAADAAPLAERWAAREVAIEGGLQSASPRLRSQILERGRATIEQARRDREQPQLWTRVAELLEREDGSDDTATSSAH